MATTAARRAYLEQHKVQTTISAATAKLIIQRPDQPAAELGRFLQDSAYQIPKGGSTLSAAEYVEKHDLTNSIALAVKKAVEEMPAEPLLAIGRVLEGKVAMDTPTKAAVASMLSKSLSTRASVSELTDKNILKAAPGSVSSGIQAHKAELEKSMAIDALHHHLEKRATAQELQDKGILKASPGSVSGGIQAHKAELEKSMTIDALHQHLEKRATAQELQDKGILPSESSVKRPSLQRAPSAPGMKPPPKVPATTAPPPPVNKAPSAKGFEPPPLAPTSPTPPPAPPMPVS